MIDLVIQTRDEGAWTVVGVSGEVDLYTAPKLRERIVELVEQGRLRLIVDLEHVEFIDSTGLGILVGALKRVKEREGDLALAGARRPVLRVLTITGLDGVFRLYETVGEAVAAD